MSELLFFFSHISNIVTPSPSHNNTPVMMQEEKEPTSKRIAKRRAKKAASQETAKATKEREKEKEKVSTRKRMAKRRAGSQEKDKENNKEKDTTNDKEKQEATPRRNTNRALFIYDALIVCVCLADKKSSYRHKRCEDSLFVTPICRGSAEWQRQGKTTALIFVMTFSSLFFLLPTPNHKTIRHHNLPFPLLLSSGSELFFVLCWICFLC